MVNEWYYKGTHTPECIGNVAGFYNKKDEDGEIIKDKYLCSYCSRVFTWTNEE